MHRSLLPQLPRLSGAELAARYRPAPQASRVGGDWYDAFVLPDGTAVLALGDVVGHDLQAAARMAEVRSTLRAFARDRRTFPGEVVSRLDQALTSIGITTMATLVFARLETAAGGLRRLRWTNAGHPPPLLVDCDARPRFLDYGSDLLLGTGLATEREDAAVLLESPATVLFYTDGLVESSVRPLEEGMAALGRRAADRSRTCATGSSRTSARRTTTTWC